MSRRVGLVLAALALVALVAWLLWSKRGESGSTQPLGTRDATPSSIEPPAGDLERVSGSSGERVEVTSRAPAEPANAGTAAETRLEVLVRSKETNQPLADVRVGVTPKTFEGGMKVENVEGTRGSIGKSPRTGAEGLVELDVPPGVLLALYASGEKGSTSYARTEVPALAAGETRRVELQVQSTIDLDFHGRVVDRESGTPVAGARVTLTHFFRDAPPPILRTTDANGRFDVRVASWRLPRSQVEAEGYSLMFFAIAPGHETPERALHLALKKGAVLEITLLDARRSSISGATVVLSTDSYQLNASRELGFGSGGGFVDSDPRWNATTDERGVARFRDLPAQAPLEGDARSAKRSIYKLKDPITLEAGETRKVEWIVGTGTAIVGRVTDTTGAPLAKCTVFLLRKEGDKREVVRTWVENRLLAQKRTDADGRFRFENVAPGTYAVGPKNEQNTTRAALAERYAPVAEIVEVVEGTAEQSVDVVVVRGLYIHGTVLSPGGDPIPDAQLSATSSEMGGYPDGRSGKDGIFDLGPLTPGRWSVRVIHAEGYYGSEPVEANAGDTNVVVRVIAAGGLEGKVVDPTTDRGASSEVVVAPVGDTPGGMWTTSTKVDGSFTIENLPAGTYSVSARTSDSRVGISTSMVVVTAGSTTKGVVVDLKAGGKLTVRYVGSSPYGQISLRHDGVVIAGDGLKSGSSAEWTVPLGTVVVRLWESETKAVKDTEVVVEAGKVAEVVVGKD